MGDRKFTLYALKKRENMVFQKLITTSCFIFFLKLSSIAYAHDHSLQDTISNLLEHVKTSIERVEDERIVFCPEKTCFYQGNIYVEDNDGDFINLSSFSNQLSYNGSELAFLTKQPRIMLYICSNCTFTYRRYSNEPAPTFCERCKNRDFLIRYQ